MREWWFGPRVTGGAYRYDWWPPEPPYINASPDPAHLPVFGSPIPPYTRPWPWWRRLLVRVRVVVERDGKGWRVSIGETAALYHERLMADRPPLGSSLKATFDWHRERLARGERRM